VDLSFRNSLNPTMFRRMFAVIHLPLLPTRRARQPLDSFLALDPRGVGSKFARARLAERAEFAAKVLTEEV